MMKKLMAALMALLLAAAPACATSLDDLVASLNARYPAIALAEIDQAFGGEGEPQGEVYATGLFAGAGYLYPDEGHGSAAADLLFLQLEFAATSFDVLGRAATRYELKGTRVWVLAQIAPGWTLVVLDGQKAEGEAEIPAAPTASPMATWAPAAPTASPPPAATPSPAPTERARKNVLVATINGQTREFTLDRASFAQKSLVAVFASGEDILYLGMPESIAPGDVVTPECVLGQAESFPYITFMWGGEEYYALAWNELSGFNPDLSATYAVRMEPSEAADYAIFLSEAGAEYAGSFTATLAGAKDARMSVEISGEFRFSRPAE